MNKEPVMTVTAQEVARAFVEDKVKYYAELARSHTVSGAGEAEEIYATILAMLKERDVLIKENTGNA